MHPGACSTSSRNQSSPSKKNDNKISQSFQKLQLKTGDCSPPRLLSSSVFPDCTLGEQSVWRVHVEHECRVLLLTCTGFIQNLCALNPADDETHAHESYLPACLFNPNEALFIYFFLLKCTCANCIVAMLKCLNSSVWIIPTCMEDVRMDICV